MLPILIGGEYVSGLLFGEDIESSDYMGACNLGSLFLHNFVVNPFKKGAYVDYDKLETVIHKAVRFLDCIIDINKFPYPAYENYQKQLRTIGLGITGLANTLVMCGLRYGSEKSVLFTDYLMNFISRTAYMASIMLASEKGSFPLLNSKEFIKSGFIQKHIDIDSSWNEIKNGILGTGIRNARILSVAPVGTLSLTYGNNSSSGLEPTLMLKQKRKVKFGGQSEENAKMVDLIDCAYDMWQKMKEKDVKEDVFVTINDIGVQEHLNILKVVAFHTDMSVSKTINIPTEYSFEDTKQVYMDAWKSKIKGCTIFRPNALRQGIFVQEEEEVKPKTLDYEDFPRGTIEEVPEGLEYRKYKLKTGCSNLYFFLGADENEGKIYDCFCNTDGGNGCPINTQAVSRLLSAGIRGGIPVEYLIKQLDKAGVCPSFQYKRGKGEALCKGKSCASAIGNIMKDVLKEFGSSDDDEDVIEKLDFKEVLVFTSQEVEYKNKHGEIAFAKNFNKCPVCGNHLAHIDGCISCLSCGWSKCGE